MSHERNSFTKAKLFNSLIALGWFSGMTTAINPLISVADSIVGETIIDGEASRIFFKAKQCEDDLDYKAAQKFYEEVVEVQPNYIYAWSNLGNVLTAQGNLQDAILCYKKAISLRPPKDQLAIIILNKASIELSLGQSETALKDLEIAERLSGSTSNILTNKAVALTQSGEWEKSCDLFERVISSADRNALPWWLRYSMALMETNRGMEGVAYLQRTLNRFPEEPECKAFAVSLYTFLGSKIEAGNYWKSMTDEDRKTYSAEGFISKQLHWGPKAQKKF